jgi:hypothetical protein
MVQERALADKGTYRLMSAVDLESTFRKHEGSPAVFGTTPVLATTATRIRAVVALTGSTPDGEGTIAVLDQQRAAEQPLPPFLIMDRAAGYGKYRARVDVASRVPCLSLPCPMLGCSRRASFDAHRLRRSDGDQLLDLVVGET